MPTAPTAIVGFRGFCSWSGKKPLTSSRECNRSPPLTPVLNKLKDHALGQVGQPERIRADKGYPGKRMVAFQKNAISAGTTPIDGIGARRAVRPQKAEGRLWVDDRDRGTPRGATLPHHRAYGSVPRRFDR